MSFARAEAVADAVLYEGYMLYPYRRSSLKNQRPSLFGALDPDTTLECEWLVRGGPAWRLQGKLRALHVRMSDSGEAGVPCEAEIPAFEGGAPLERPARTTLRSPAGEPLAELELGCASIGGDVYRVRAVVRGAALPSAAALSSALVSAHAIVAFEGASVVPPRDPPADLAPAAAACRSSGLWPILLGDPTSRDLVLCSPIILDDHPAVAPESTGDLFDATEIDEILSLRIMTLAPGERDEAARGDPRVRRLLERTEQMGPEDLARLHGARRAAAETAGRIAVGDRVRLRPKGRSDIFDIALAGRVATVVGLETDLEGRRYVAVTVDDDPGKDLGATGKPGHKFFFAPSEVETVAAE